MADYPTRIDTPSAWNTLAVQQDQTTWRLSLDDADTAELDAAMRGFMAMEKPLGLLQQQDFALANIQQKLSQLRHDLMHGLGFALLSGLDITRYSQAELAVIFFGVGAHLGSARSQNAQGYLLGHVRDTGADAQSPQTRIYQTTQRQTSIPTVRMLWPCCA